jgi:hypothetical protein
VPSAAAAQRRDIDALGTAMDRVGARIAGLGEHLFGFDDLVNLRLERLFHVDHVDPATTGCPGMIR